MVTLHLPSLCSRASRASSWPHLRSCLISARHVHLEFLPCRRIHRQLHRVDLVVPLGGVVVVVRIVAESRSSTTDSIGAIALRPVSRTPPVSRGAYKLSVCQKGSSPLRALWVRSKPLRLGRNEAKQSRIVIPLYGSRIAIGVGS